MSKLLHGVPHHEWIGRMVKGEGHTKGRGTKARNPCKIISFSPNGRLVEVHPSGHRGTEWVTPEQILPWWTRNDDLRKKYMVDARGTEESLFSEMARIKRDEQIEEIIRKHSSGKTSANLGIGGESIRREKEEPVASPQVSEPEPIPPVQTIMPPPPKPIVKAVQAPVVPQVPSMGIKRIIVDPNASDTWMEDLKDLKESIAHKKEADEKVLMAQREAEEAAEIVKSYALALVNKGVTIEWDIPTPTAPSKSTAGRARTEQDIPEAILTIVRQYRSQLLKQMVPGRTYNTEDLRIMLQAEPNDRFMSLMNHTFRNHPRLHRVQGNRYKETTFSVSA